MLTMSLEKKLNKLNCTTMTTLTPNSVSKPTHLLKKTLLVTSNRRSRTMEAVGLEPLRVGDASVGCDNVSACGC